MCELYDIRTRTLLKMMTAMQLVYNFSVLYRTHVFTFFTGASHWSLF